MGALGPGSARLGRNKYLSAAEGGRDIGVPKATLKSSAPGIASAFRILCRASSHQHSPHRSNRDPRPKNGMHTWLACPGAQTAHSQNVSHKCSMAPPDDGKTANCQHKITCTLDAAALATWIQHIPMYLKCRTPSNAHLCLLTFPPSRPTQPYKG